MPGGQGCPAVAGTGGVSGGEPQGQHRLLQAAAVAAAVRDGFRDRREDDGAGQGRLDGDGLSWARAVRVVCRLRASQVSAWDWSQPKASFPVLKVVSTGHLRPAMGEEIGQGRGAAFGGMAQVERVLVLFPVREAADQQELLRALRGEQRPVRVAGAFRPVPAGPLFEHRLRESPGQRV